MPVKTLLPWLPSVWVTIIIITILLSLSQPTSPAPSSLPPLLLSVLLYWHLAFCSNSRLAWFTKRKPLRITGESFTGNLLCLLPNRQLGTNLIHKKMRCFTVGFENMPDDTENSWREFWKIYWNFTVLVSKVLHNSLMKQCLSSTDVIHSKFIIAYQISKPICSVSTK